MKTKIVYVLVSSSADYYLEQTLISVYSCRLHNPNANILIVSDFDTKNTLKGKRAEILKYISNIIVKEIPPDYNQIQKSRYLKTSLRDIVDGDFIYIDSDTVIAEPLDEIDLITDDLAAVYDSNRQSLITNSNYISDKYINFHTNNLGWPSVIGFPNYNGGVLFVRDCEISHKFFAKWFELWKECISKGTNIDMAALCRSNIELGCCIKELSGIWNCQIQRQGLPLLPNAKIIHCFTGGNITLYELCTERILEKVKHYGIDDEVLGLIKNAKNAFLTNSAIVPKQEAELLNLPINRLYVKHNFCFRVFNKMASILLHF